MAGKILVVDDEPGLLELFKDILKGAGYSVSTFDRGKGVIDKIKEVQPDLLLLDIMLPNEDGYSIARTMSETPPLDRVPILVMTALADSKPFFKKFEQVKGFIYKPVDPGVLLQQIKDVLAES